MQSRKIKVLTGTNPWYCNSRTTPWDRIQTGFGWEIKLLHSRPYFRPWLDLLQPQTIPLNYQPIRSKKFLNYKPKRPSSGLLGTSRTQGHVQNSLIWPIYDLPGETAMSTLLFWACHVQKEQHHLCRTWTECKLKCHVAKGLSQSTATPPQSNKNHGSAFFGEPASETSLCCSVSPVLEH